MIIYENGFWIPVYQFYICNYEYKMKTKYTIILEQDSNEFYSNGIKFKDFEQINENDVNDAIDKYIIGRRL